MAGNSMKTAQNFGCELFTVDLLFSKSEQSFNGCSVAIVQKATAADDSEILQPSCVSPKNATCFLDCVKKEETSVRSELGRSVFWYLFALYVTFGVGYTIAVTFSDTICFQVIGDDTQLYGKLRIPGSFGWGIGGFVTGWLIDRFSSHNSTQKNYQPMIIFVVVVFLIDAVWSRTLKVDRSSVNSFNLQKVYGLFRRFDVLLFAFWSFLVGFFQQMTWQYVFWYVEEISRGEDVNWIKTLQGFLTFSNTVTGDTFSFYTSGWLFRKFGFKNCMTASLFLSSIRFFAYSILKVPIWSIPISSLDGIIYGLQYCLIASYCNVIAAPGTEATVQAVFNCIFDGIGTSIGGLCGGFLYSWLGGAATFRLYCYLSFAFGVLHLLLRNVSSLLKVMKPLSALAYDLSTGEPGCLEEK